MTSLPDLTNSKDPIFQPLELGHIVLRNRIVSTAHAPNYTDENNHPGERYALYQEEKAKGGVALTIIGASSTISADSPALWGQIDVSDDSVVDALSNVAQRVKAHGSAILCQITHMGRRTVDNAAGFLPIIGPSNTRERLHRSFPKAMELSDIARVTQDFVSAALRCKMAGLDGVEILSFGHLLGQFMSPAVNQRDDAYGGTPENRLRLTIEVLSAVRAAMGRDFVIGLRMAGDEQSENGLTPADCAEIARRLDDMGLVDYLNINAGLPETEAQHSKWIPGMGFGAAPFLEVAKFIKSAVSVPVLHAGSINDLATARHVLRDGIADMVGMTRAHVADPYLVAKAAQGKEDCIRPCVGTGFCIDRVAVGLDLACAHNVVTGRESKLSHRIELSGEPPLKAMVVGGGPGGMEAARVLASRGHDVSLHEASGRLGGQLNLASKPTSRRQMHSIADWLQTELERLEVSIHYNTFVGKQEVLTEAPDIVIVATGGLPDTDVARSGNEHITSIWEVLSGETKVGGDVLLYDDHGSHQGVSCAEFLLDSGAGVTLVTPDREMAHEIGTANRSVYMRKLYKMGITIIPDTVLNTVEREGNRYKVTLCNDYSEELSTRIVDHILVEHGVQPFEDLFHDLAPHSTNLGQLDLERFSAGAPQTLSPNPTGMFRLHRVGDAVSSRDVHSAMYDAHRLCRHL